MQKKELVQMSHLSEQIAGEFYFNYIELFLDFKCCRSILVFLNNQVFKSVHFECYSEGCFFAKLPCGRCLSFCTFFYMKYFNKMLLGSIRVHTDVCSSMGYSNEITHMETSESGKVLMILS